MGALKCFLVLTAIIFTASCASLPTKGQPNMAEDLGSPAKVKLLEKRASEYWATMVKGDLREAYKYYDPFMKARMSAEEFVLNHGVVKYHDFKITNVKVEGNVAKVTVKVKYSVPKIRVKLREFEIPEKEEEFDETWLFVYDNWYKEYYLRLFETGIASY